MTAFFLKRPGQDSDDAETIAGHSDSWPSNPWAGADEWALFLRHSCDAWVIGSGALGETLAEAREFRDHLDEAIRVLEAEQARDGQEPARYAAARAGAAQSFREAGAEADAGGFTSLAGIAAWQAQEFERWSPFAALADRGIKPYDLVLPAPPEPWDGPKTSAGCYAASWGWVHVRPGCRCVR